MSLRNGMLAPSRAFVLGVLMCCIKLTCYVLGLFLEMACLACFMKWRAWCPS